MIIKTIFFQNTEGAPEDRYEGQPSFVGQKFLLFDIIEVVVREVIEVNPKNQLVVLDYPTSLS